MVVGYRTKAGKLADVRLDWQVNPPLPASVDAQITSVGAAAGLGLDLEQDIVQRVRKSLFAPQVVDAEKKAARKAIRGVLADLESGMPNVFEARKVTTPSGSFGYLRVRTFSVFPPENFVNEFIRLITALPPRGLILDVRGNGGGVINAGEFALQTLTPTTHRARTAPVHQHPAQSGNLPPQWQGLELDGSVGVGRIDAAGASNRSRPFPRGFQSPIPGCAMRSARSTLARWS